jgi:uncharacterized protein
LPWEIGSDPELTRLNQLDGDDVGAQKPGVVYQPEPPAVALARDANDEASSAVRAHPERFRAFATLPTSDPQAAAAELGRCATQLGHVGAMVRGRTGNRALDDPAYDDLFATAARCRQPIFIHPQVP